MVFEAFLCRQEISAWRRERGNGTKNNLRKHRVLSLNYIKAAAFDLIFL